MISLSVLFCSSCPICFLYFRRYCEVICNFNTYDDMFSCVLVNLHFQRTIDGQEPYVVELKGHIVSIVVMTSQYLRKYRKQIGQDEQNKTDSEIIRMEIYSINEMHHEVLIHKMTLIIACVCNQLNNCRHNYINVIHLYV
jgi:hypothetical protein